MQQRSQGLFAPTRSVYHFVIILCRSTCEAGGPKYTPFHPPKHPQRVRHCSWLKSHHLAVLFVSEAAWARVWGGVGRRDVLFPKDLHPLDLGLDVNSGASQYVTGTWPARGGDDDDDNAERWSWRKQQAPQSVPAPWIPPSSDRSLLVGSG